MGGAGAMAVNISEALILFLVLQYLMHLWVSFL